MSLFCSLLFRRKHSVKHSDVALWGDFRDSEATVKITLEKHTREENRSFDNFSFINERPTFSYYFHACFFPNPCFFFYRAQKREFLRNLHAALCKFIFTTVKLQKDK